MDAPVISVIVPVHNVKKYLDECVQNVLNQSFTRFELLIIDDGSTDCSGEICDRWAKNDDRVYVFHKGNGGVSSARNMGLGLARGKWVIFLDADDFWYRTDSLETLLNVALEKDADIARGEYKAIKETGETLFERKINSLKCKHVDKVVPPAIFLKDVMQGENFLIMSLIKAERVITLPFNINLSLGEDADWFARLFLQPLACVFIPFRFYAHRKRQSSASQTPSVRMLADSFMMCDRYEQYSRQASDKRLRRYFENYSVMMYFWTLNTLGGNSYYENRTAIINDLGLKELQRRTCNRVFCLGVFNKYFPVFMLSPIVGVHLLRIRQQIMMRIYTIARWIKK